MRKLAVIAGSLAALVVLLWGGAHLLIAPVNPKQDAPAGHVEAACWTCHIVTTSAEVRDVR